VFGIHSNPIKPLPHVHAGIKNESGKHTGCQLLKYPRAKFSFQINWALQHMIKIHNCDEGPPSLLKISLSEKEKKRKKKKKTK
jgi:hypothetical protein